MIHLAARAARLGSGLAAVVLLLAGAPPAQAVVVSGGYDAPNLVVPGDDPGWANIGRVAGGSGIYLGNRWVLTANHVSGGAFILDDGRQFLPAPGTDVRVANPGVFANFGDPDLRMFRLADDPGLPALQIASASPAVGAAVTMIGYGLDRQPQLQGWQAIGSGSDIQWNPAPLPIANFRGFLLGTDSHKRWGTNQVSTAPTFLPSSATFTYSTTFDQFGNALEAQATTGDSGGGVFQKIDGQWLLTGVMTSVTRPAGQPENTVLFGAGTQIAEMASYRNQILELIDKPDSPWQNQRNLYDVDGSGRTNPRDMLLLINQLQSKGAHDLTGTPGPGDFLYDVNGDGRLSPIDLNRIIVALQSGNANLPTGLSSGGNFVPEPESWALLAVGLASLALLAARRRRRARA